MDGFVLAYFTKFQVNRVIPITWIKDVDMHLEKFLNAGLNSAQIHTCFYTSNPNAFDAMGMPKIGFEPNFDAPFRANLDGDGRFAIKLKVYRGNAYLNTPCGDEFFKNFCIINFEIYYSNARWGSG